jgi:hypothetical protein
MILRSRSHEPLAMLVTFKQLRCTARSLLHMLRRDRYPLVKPWRSFWEGCGADTELSPTATAHDTKIAQL